MPPCFSLHLFTLVYFIITTHYSDYFPGLVATEHDKVMCPPLGKQQQANYKQTPNPCVNVKVLFFFFTFNKN